MKEEQILESLLERYPSLLQIDAQIRAAYGLLKGCYEKKGKLLVCGNGGSAADSEHIVGELMKGFLQKRELDQRRQEDFRRLGEDYRTISEKLQGALPAISLAHQSALNTAYANDVSPDMVFGQQVYGYGEGGRDVLLTMSTSGNSVNVVNAVKVAKAIGVASVGITGESGGRLKELCDVCIRLPEKETYKVQELTLPVYHALCAMLEEYFFGRQQKQQILKGKGGTT